MACVFLAEAIQCTCDRKAATGSFNKGLKIKSTTVLLSGGWVPMIPRSFHYGHPASYLAGKSPGEGGVLPYMGLWVCAAVKGRVFKQFTLG